MTTPPTPVAGAYWVEPGALLAGEYPGAIAAGQAAERVGRFLAAGVTLFVDLTEADEPLEPYAHLLDAARHERRPIPDMGTVAPVAYAEILDLVDAERAAGGCAYVHCWGGIGRTGTVVGCWLVRHGRDRGDPIAGIAALRAGTPDRRLRSPQTPAQEAVIARWARGA